MCKARKRCRYEWGRKSWVINDVECEGEMTVIQACIWSSLAGPAVPAGPLPLVLVAFPKVEVLRGHRGYALASVMI